MTAADPAALLALASELCERDRDLPGPLEQVARALADLREQAQGQVATFVAAVRQGGAPHLAQLEVSPLEPDEKHVDCLQFAVRRGRWELVCVGKPRGEVTLVGPYRRGKPERPCQDQPLPSGGARAALTERLIALIQEASAR